MIVHLLRHADAENFVTTDASRELTEKGHQQAERVGDFLTRTREPIQLILTSPYLRALQTAQAVEKKLPKIPILQDSRLGCGLSPHTGLAIIQEYAKVDHLLIVGHQPDLSFLAAHLLTRDGSIHIDFKKASLLTIVMTTLSPAAGYLESYLNVTQM